MKWGMPALSGGVLLTSVVAVPILAYTQIPLAARDVAGAYIAASAQVELATTLQKTEGVAVRVPWEEAIALDAALLGQDFDQIAPRDLQEHAETATRRFVAKHEVEHEHCTDEEDRSTCTREVHRWFTLWSLDEVMARQGFTDEKRAWVRTMRQNADLLISGR